MDSCDPTVVTEQAHESLVSTCKRCSIGRMIRGFGRLELLQLLTKVPRVHEEQPGFTVSQPEVSMSRRMLGHLPITGASRAQHAVGGGTEVDS